MPKHNDLDIANRGWEKYLGVLNPGSWWSFPHRGIGGDASYPGNFIPEIPRQLIPRLSKKGDFIADMFAGSETTAHVCAELERIYVGCDLRPRTAITDEGDARTWDPGVEAQMVFLHPPYSDIIDYNEKLGAKDGDLSLPWLEFIKEFKLVVDNAWRITREGGYAVLIMADRWDSKNREHMMLASYCAFVMAMSGWLPKQDIVKNFGNEVANKNKNAHLWFRRALLSDFCILEHEHVFVFKKESKTCPTARSFLESLSSLYSE